MSGSISLRNVLEMKSMIPTLFAFRMVTAKESGWDVEGQLEVDIAFCLLENGVD